MIGVGRRRQILRDNGSRECPHSISFDAPAHEIRTPSSLSRSAAFSRFLTYFCYNFHFVPVIENHHINVHVTPVIKSLPFTHVIPQSPRACRMERKHIVWIFTYRIALALLTRSFFQPDEFFQSLEVAHNLVFGYGKLTWEWQPDVAIRSIAYPALYVPIYWILRVTSLDATGLLVREFLIIPKVSKHHLSVSFRYMHQNYSMV